MLRQRCPQELDWEVAREDQQTGNTSTCTFVDGVDANATRYDLIEEWIRSFDMFTDKDVKFAILPFSGGIKQRPHPELGDANKMLFLDRDDALGFSQQLKGEQMSDKIRLQQDMALNPDFMGTSVPLPVLSYAKNLIEAEMYQLEQESKLAETPFHFVYLSDGVFKPTQQILERAKEVMGCNLPSCSSTPPSGYTCEYFDGRNVTRGACCRQICDTHLPQLVKDNWGDPEDNQYDKIIAALKDIQNLEDRYFSAEINLHMLKLYPTEIAEFPWEPNNEDWSIFDGILEESLSVDMHIYEGGEPPFYFDLPINEEIHFEVENLYVVNLNTYVDSFNRLSQDSDSDGLDDSLEESKSYNPNKARSNGICLDVITEKFRCDQAITLTCLKDFDFDGDGLNQCEEQILGTNEKSVDTDGDGVMDGHEILKGLNPLKDDHEDFSASDSFTAMDHFKRGVHPIVNINKVIPEYMIDLKISKGDYARFTGDFGNTYYSYRYQLEVDNIPQKRMGPYFNTHYPSRGMRVADDYDPLQYLMGTQHSSDSNEVLVMLKVRQVQKPKQKLWFFKRIQVNTAAGENIRFRLDQMQALDVIDIQAGEN